MASVSVLAKELGVSPQTIRSWAAEFADYLSAAATPPKGQPRHFNDDDAAALALVAEMRSRLAGYEAIHAALAAGDRAEWPPRPPEAPQYDDTAGQSDSALVTRLTATVARFEGKLEATEGERDHLRVQLADEQAARLDAEKRAAGAEAKLSQIENQVLISVVHSEQTQEGVAGESGASKRPWWKVWG